MKTSLDLNQKKQIVRIFRSPTLDTVKMVEDTINKYSGEYTRRKIWEKLPRKVMWGTFKKIISYLEEINKIVVARKGVLVYIWSPEAAKRVMRLQRKKL